MAGAAQTWLVRLAAVLALLLGGCAGAESGPVRQGQAAPPLALATLAGAPLDVRPAGRPLWLTFWATWCYPCRAEWPGLNQAARDLSGQGLTLVAISVNEPSGTVQQFLAERPASFEVALDPQGQAAGRYGVVGFPTHVLIDESGVVRAVVHGPLDGRRARALLHLAPHPTSLEQSGVAGMRLQQR
jgi:cytochrome c biogenesis protein CcmG, thiol:disulfide interchange protein DsbE